MIALITDAELLELSLASEALNGIASTVRDTHRTVNSDLVRSRLSCRVSTITSEDFEPEGDIKIAVAALTAWSLLRRRGFNPAAGKDSEIEKSAIAADAWIKDVIAGDAEVLTAATDKRAPLVGGSATSNWEGWRRWPQT
jgi:hypothetical protein